MRKKIKINNDILAVALTAGCYYGFRKAIKHGKTMAALALGIATTVFSGVIYDHAISSSVDMIDDLIFDNEDDED